MRIIVNSIEDMPGEARDGLPLGCVLETERGEWPRVVAFGQGGTWSQEGLRLAATDVVSYAAYAGEDDEAIMVRATDIHAALMWLRYHFTGPFNIYVRGASTFIGEFGTSEEGQSCDSRCRAYPTIPCPIHRDEGGQV